MVGEAEGRERRRVGSKEHQDRFEEDCNDAEVASVELRWCVRPTLPQEMGHARGLLSDARLLFYAKVALVDPLALAVGERHG